LFSHGTYNTRYFYGMNEEQQRAVIRENRETIKRASGQELDGWLTPAISNDETTQHLLAEEGIKYTLDMLHDDQPTPIKTRSGHLISIPYSLEINDVPLLVMRNTPPDRFAAICKAQFDQLYEEGAESGTVMCMPLHPFLIGQPHRIGALDEVLRYVAGHDKVWFATGREIAAWYTQHYLAEAQSWIAAGTP
jgi:peptidoglycan/xylan/chitin deacetylase (PgdA/CDA1 family)